MVRIAICEDDLRELTELKELVNTFVGEHILCYDIKGFYSGEELLIDIEDMGVFDIIFLDIEMGGLDGVAVAREIRAMYPKTIVIFVSAHSEYYKAAFDVQPFQFIDKPVDFHELYDICCRVLELITQQRERLSFFFKNTYYSIDTGDILYIESDRRIIRIVCDTERFEFYGKLNDVERRLADGQMKFIRIHQSYLVSIQKIKVFSYNSIVMSNNDQLVVSRDRRKNVRDTYINFLQKRADIFWGR